MPQPVARLGDTDSRGKKQIEGVPTVLVNGIPICVTGNADNGSGDDPRGNAIGVPTVFVAGLPVFCVGDSDTAGRTQVQGSPTVFAR